MSGMTKIELVGCVRYGYKGSKYERNIHYLVKDDRAKLLLRLTTDHGFMVFKEVGKPFQPVITEQPVEKERDLPVIDTSKTEAERHDEAVVAAVLAIEEESKPVVVQDESELKVEPEAEVKIEDVMADVTEEELGSEGSGADEDGGTPV